MSQSCHDCGVSLDDVAEGQPCPACGSVKRDATVLARTVAAYAHVPTPTVWLTYTFAPEWLSEAREEAKVAGDHSARRREIVFAVCFAESYLFEFVRDSIPGIDFQRVSEFFPPGDRRGICDRWKEVVRQLLQGGFLSEPPPSGDKLDQDWDRLVEYRDGLVHARSSRPQTHPQPEAERPLPSKSTLDELEPGWAVRVVVTRAQRLHEASKTSAPSWLAYSFVDAKWQGVVTADPLRGMNPQAALRQ